VTKKIIALVTEAFGGSGGIAQANRDLFETLGKKFEIIILPRKTDHEPHCLPENIRQEPAVMNRFLYSLRAYQIMKREHADTIFCGHLFMTPTAWIIAKLAGVSFWVHLHGIEAWESPGSWVEAAAERAKLVTCISRFTRTKFLSWSRVDPQTVKILPDTYSERFKPGPKPKDLVERYGLEGKKVLLTLGRLSSQEKYKGHDKVIEALPKIIERIPDVVYVIAGEGDDRRRLELLAKKTGVCHQVVFAGYVSEADLPALHRMADVFVMPSMGEGFGIVFLEAAASGIFVIGGSEDGSVDALREGRLGATVTTNDPDLLITAICQGLHGAAIQNMEVERFSKRYYSPHVLKLTERFALV
jgi:phosphatidylinositol alpha-1,6-mannosyltransferase